MTLYTKQTKSWHQARESDAGNVQGVIGYLVGDQVLAQDDVVQMIKIPLGAIVMECILETAAMGSNVLGSVGDDLDVDRYITATNIAAASLTRRNSVAPLQGPGIPYRYVSDQTIDVVLSNANPTDNMSMRLDVFYICGAEEEIT
jgi:hypothetical protein